MSTTYYKRYRMELDLTVRLPACPAPPSNYGFMPWDAGLLEEHAEAKFRSFQWEIDANVFPCLGDYLGCRRLMHEISSRDGFISTATWLAVQHHPYEPCGTIQAIVASPGVASIQNIGVVPEHRNRRLGVGLILRALHAFQDRGLHLAFLEVTADNEAAIRLYHRLGFRKARTVYKVSEIAYT